MSNYSNKVLDDFREFVIDQCSVSWGGVYDKIIPFSGFLISTTSAFSNSPEIEEMPFAQFIMFYNSRRISL